MTTNVEISISVSETEAMKVTYFDWEAWRNTFFGRFRRLSEMEEEGRNANCFIN